MKIIKPYHDIVTPVKGEEMLKHIEACGRVCYKSEHKITEDSYLNFAKNIIKNGHEAVIEHAEISVRFVCDRGVSHEIVRHRMASYCQESTRYCNYAKDDFSNEITVIKPCYLEEGTLAWVTWKDACQFAENSYFSLLDIGLTPQEARSVLPNSLKTEVIMTANLREWRHFLKLRTSKAAHPQMRELAMPLLADFKRYIPIIFDDIEVTL